MNNRRMTTICYSLVLYLVCTQAFHTPKLLAKKRPSSSTRLNTVALPPSTKPNTKRKSAMKSPNPPGSPLIRQVDHHVNVDVHDMEIIPSETFLVPENLDDHPFGPKTKLGHHLVDGLFLDALVLRTAPLVAGHFTSLQTSSTLVQQQNVDTFATTLKSLPVPHIKPMEIIKPIVTTLPGFMSLPDGFHIHKPFKENKAYVGDRTKKTPMVPSSNHRSGLPYDEHGAMLQKYGYWFPHLVFLLTLMFVMHGTMVGVFGILGMSPHHGLW